MFDNRKKSKEVEILSHHETNCKSTIYDSDAIIKCFNTLKHAAGANCKYRDFFYSGHLWSHILQVVKTLLYFHL